MTDVRARGQFRPEAPELHRTDFTVYTNAADVLLAGGDPYATPGPRGWYYLYPPMFAVLVSPLRGLDSQWQVVVWFAISVGLGYVCLAEGRRLGNWIWRQCRREGGSLTAEPPGWVGVVAFLTMLPPALDCLQRGQVGLLVLASLMLGLRLTLVEERALLVVLGGATLALAAVVKVTPTLVVVLYLILLATFRPRWRSVAAVGGALVGSALLWFIIPGGIVGWNENLRLLGRWRETVAANEELAANRGINPLALSNQSLGVALFRVHEIDQHEYPPPLRAEQVGVDARLAAFPPCSVADWEDPITPVRIGLVLLLVAVSIRLVRQMEPAGVAASFGLGCAATLLISPISWGHHFVLLFPSGLLVSAWFLIRGWARVAKVSAAALMILVVVHYVWMPIAGPASVLALGLVGWFVVVCVALLCVGPRLGGEG